MVTATDATAQMVLKVLRAETKALGAGRIGAVVSIEDSDRDDDVIRANGWELDQFRRHPVLLVAHDYFDLRSQIGAWELMEVQGKKLCGVVRYYVGEGNEQADWAYNLAAKGMAAYSVGFFPLEWKDREGGLGREFIRQELLEVSQVSIPANPQALQLMLKALPVLREIMDEASGKAGRIMSQANLDKLHGVLTSLEGIHEAVCDMAESCPRRKGKGRGAENMGVKGATPFVDLPIHEDRSRPYREEEVLPRVREWASSDGSGDKDKIDWTKFCRAFFWYDPGEIGNFDSCKLKFADVIDGQLTAVVRGIHLAAAVMQGARGGVDIPDADRPGVQHHIAQYYAKMEETPPWEQETRQDGSDAVRLESRLGRLSVARILDIPELREVET